MRSPKFGERTESGLRPWHGKCQEHVLTVSQAYRRRGKMPMEKRCGQAMSSRRKRKNRRAAAHGCTVRSM